MDPHACKVKCNFSAKFQVNTFSIQSCLVFCSFCTCLLLSLTTLLIVSFLSPRNRNLIFCCVLSILVLMYFVFMTLCCTGLIFYLKLSLSCSIASFLVWDFAGLSLDISIVFFFLPICFSSTYFSSHLFF